MQVFLSCFPTFPLFWFPPFKSSCKMSYLQTVAISHASKVKSLYKESLRQLQSYYVYRHTYRYQAVMMRARFDEHAAEIDMVKAKKLLIAGEKELFLNMHPQRIRFPNSPGGVAYGREVTSPDWLLDMWHPYERQQYPEYFARRNQRKEEFIKRYEEKYGSEADVSH